MNHILTLLLTFAAINCAEINSSGNDRIVQLTNAGRTADAVRAASKMISENSDPSFNGFAYMIIMNDALQSGNTDRVIEIYMSIKGKLETIPSTQQSMINVLMSGLHYKKMEFEASLLYSQKAIQTHNDNPFAHNQLAWLFATGKSTVNADTALASAQKAC